MISFMHMILTVYDGADTHSKAIYSRDTNRAKQLTHLPIPSMYEILILQRNLIVRFRFMK
jgi:hypothetical protein